VGAEVDESLIFQNMTTTTNIPLSNDRKKRRAEDSIAVSDDEAPLENQYPSFLVAEPLQGHTIDLSIFGIQKLLKCAVGDVKTAKKLRNGSVLIEVASKAQAENALKMQKWVNTPIKVTPHRSLNTCKGIIRSRDLRDCSDSEVLEALSPEGVTHIKHVFTKKNGSTIPTNTFVLTFNKSVLPKSVKAAYLNISVEPYIPNPLRCFNCQKFGHGRSSCQHKAVCARCGNDGHDDAVCQEPARCVNCSGTHPSFSRECPEWAKQRAIVQIKTERNISFSEAKQIHQKQTPQSASTPKLGISYATACKTCNTISTQTDLTWPLDSKYPLSSNNAATSHHSIETQTQSTSNHTSNQATSASANISNIPHYSSTPKQKIQLGNTKPGPASSKQVLGKKPSKGSNDPISLFNRYGSLDSMDQEVELSPGRGPGGRKNR
jgi:hypothetical protein